jgi:hypothetical protein
MYLEDRTVRKAKRNYSDKRLAAPDPGYFQKGVYRDGLGEIGINR